MRAADPPDGNYLGRNLRGAIRRACSPRGLSPGDCAESPEVSAKHRLPPCPTLGRLIGTLVVIQRAPNLSPVIQRSHP